MPSRHKILDDAEQLLNSTVDKSERAVYRSLLELLREFDTSGGRLVFDSATVNLINEAERQILEALNRSGYDSRANQYLRDFDKIKAETIAEQKAVNSINVPVRPLNAIQKSAIQQAQNILLGGGLDFNLIQPVKDILLNSATSGMSVAEAELKLREFILGNEERVGRLQRYVSQIARDTIGSYDGLLQSRIAKEFELDGYSYEGSLIKDSRPQCQRWVNEFGGVLPVKDLQQEIRWAFTNGQGMNPQTTVDTFPIYRGGWGCRHSVTAIRL